MSGKKRKVILIRAGDCAGRLPHALLCLAANLDDDVLILDEATPQLIFKHRDEIKNALCAGLSTITGSYVKYSLLAAKALRQINPHLPLIWGGWHPSLKPQQTLQSKFVDKVVVGQGEEAFRQIVNSIKAQEQIEDVVSRPYMDKGSFPVYNLDLLRNIERYIIPYVSERTISLYTQQGCPFGCKFCAINSLYGSKYSGWPIKDVIALIEKNVKKHFIDGVHFDDDNFFIQKKRPLDFASKLLEKNLNINWSSDARVDTLCGLDKSEWEILDRSGCKRLLVGAESGSQLTLDKLNKRITPEMIMEFGRLCHKYRIIPSFSMMVGVPGETQEDINETFALLDKLKRNIPNSELLLFLYTPYPGTPLYEVAKSMGFKEPAALNDWGEFYLNVPTVPWVDAGLIERVKQYNMMFSAARDLNLKNKFKRSFSLRLSMRKINNLTQRLQREKNKKEAVLRFIKKRLLRKG